MLYILYILYIYILYIYTHTYMHTYIHTLLAYAILYFPLLTERKHTLFYSEGDNQKLKHFFINYS